MKKKKKKKTNYIFHSAEDILNHLKYDTVYRFDKYTRPEFRGYDYIHNQQKVTWLEGGGVLIENFELTYGEKLFNEAPEDFRKQIVIEYNEWFRWLV